MTAPVVLVVGAQVHRRHHAAGDEHEVREREVATHRAGGDRTGEDPLGELGEAGIYAPAMGDAGIERTTTTFRQWCERELVPALAGAPARG